MDASRSLASDNAAGAHPAILAAIERANAGHALAYGEDVFTAAARRRFREHFGEAAETLFVFGGSGANVVALRSAVDSWQAVVCAASAHIHVDECAAPERFLGGKVLPVPTPDGKLTPELVRPHLWGRGVVHHAQVRALSITQPTEWGTLYEPAEIRALAALAHEHDMVLHLDGARLANAAAALDLPLRALTTDVGVDVLSFGGTKNGLLFGEAVVFLEPGLFAAAPYHQKQAMQLPSKMRFVAAQFDRLLQDDLWRDAARHANAMARRLAEALTPLPGVEIVQAVRVNGVFVRFSPDVLRALHDRFVFHTWDEAASIARLMTAWDTEAEDVDAFAAATRALVAPA